MPQTPIFTPIDSWVGEHQAYRQPIDGQYSFPIVEAPRSGPARTAVYNEASDAFRQLIATAIADGKTLRARGSSWSLSKVGVPDHRLINPKALRTGFTVPSRRVSASYPDDPGMLRFVECGFSVNAVNRLLFDAGLSLKASGSNDGQTLAGVVSTGTHGSAFRFGAVQDFVVGLHLITGPNTQVFLERASYPVVTPGYADLFHADLIRDDALFDAALVSFGSFGIVHGLLIETRPLFVLHASRKVMPWNAALQKAVGALDFSDLALPRSASNLYHFEVFWNPNEGTPPGEAIVLQMYEGAFPADYTPPVWDTNDAGMGATGLEIMSHLLGAIPDPLNDVVKPLLNSQVRDELAEYEKTGTIRDIFRGETIKGKNLACGVGIPLDRTLEALDVAFDTYANESSVLPLLISTRYVKGTRATLGFTRFPTTCVLELDGVNTKKVRDYVTRVLTGLESQGIPFTLHWGKYNAYLTKTRVRAMYGDAALQSWLDAREDLFESDDAARVFDNAFLRSVGLSPTT